MEPIPTCSAEEERQEGQLWRAVVIGEQEHRINMKSIEPYQKVISHGGDSHTHTHTLMERHKSPWLCAVRRGFVDVLYGENDCTLR